jgi:hypothetical protein
MQLDRAAFAATARKHGYDRTDPDIVAQAGGGGVESRSVQARPYTTTLRLHHPGVRENFEVGTIIEGKGEYFSARIPRAERKQRMVDELLANRTFRDYAKRKFGELQSASGAGQQGKRGKPRKRPKTYRTAAAKKRR